MIDINQMGLFVHVVRAASFAEVGRRKGVPSNTVSRQIAQLEIALGTRLLQRSTRKLSLTSAGQALYDQIAESVEIIEHASATILDGGKTASGPIRIAVPADFFDIFPMAHVKKFLEEHPEVQLEFLLSDARVDLIAERTDLAFRGGNLPDSSYVVKKLTDNFGVLVASPGLIINIGMPRQLVDLQAVPCITDSHPLDRLVWHMDGPRGAAEVAVRASFKANTVVAQKRACISGLGVAFLPHEMVRDELARGELIRVLPDHQRSLGGLYAVLPSRRHLPLAVRRFMEFAAEKLRSSMELPIVE